MDEIPGRQYSKVVEGSSFTKRREESSWWWKYTLTLIETATMQISIVWRVNKYANKK